MRAYFEDGGLARWRCNVEELAGGGDLLPASIVSLISALHSMLYEY
jgi:hypothetical protein